MPFDNLVVDAPPGDYLGVPPDGKNPYKGHILIITDDYLKVPQSGNRLRPLSALFSVSLGRSAPASEIKAVPDIRSGVGRSLTNVKRKNEEHGYRVSVIYPDRDKFHVVNWLPKHPEIDLAVWPRSPEFSVRRQLDSLKPDFVYIATPEGVLGQLGVHNCRVLGLNYTTGIPTRVHQYVAEMNIPLISWAAEKWGGQFIRGVNRGASRTLVLNKNMIEELKAEQVENMVYWPRGVDTDLFRPLKPGEPNVYREMALKPPYEVSASRLSEEKGLLEISNSFMPGTLIFMGEGPQESVLRKAFPKAVFLGHRTGEEYARFLRCANSFLFPSTSDAKGNVQLEALASGLPEAYRLTDALGRPNAASLSIFTRPGIGVGNDDFTLARQGALALSEQGCAAACRQHILDSDEYNGWEKTAGVLEENLFHVNALLPRKRKAGYVPGEGLRLE